MSAMTLAGRKVPGNPHPNSRPPIGRPSGVTVVKVPDWRPLWGFGWCRSGAPSVDFEGLTLPGALDAFPDAWRRCNGESWAWLFTYAGKPVANDVDDLLEQLDEVNVGDRPFAELRLGAA
jgi:hypothetical protein